LDVSSSPVKRTPLREVTVQSSGSRVTYNPRYLRGVRVERPPLL
jgi:hypothetical protein